jgi:hypothetical protein
MQLVDDELFAHDPAPPGVCPSEVPRISDFRGSVRSLRLKSGRRVGQCLFTSIEAETIAHAGSRWQAPQRKVAVDLGSQCRRLETFDLDDNLAAAGRPDAEMDAAAQLRLGADRQAANGCRLGRNQVFR